MAHLLRGGRILHPGSRTLTALLIDQGRIAWMGTDDEARGLALAGVEVTELAGALVTPGFVDAHVHATSTGLTVLGVDLTGTKSARDVLDAVSRQAAAHPGALILGHGWDESTWNNRTLPTASEIDQAALGARVYLTRIDVHSALVSSTLIDAAPECRGVVGFDNSGWVTQEAHHVLRDAALGTIDDVTRRRAQDAFLDSAAAYGIVSAHEMAGPVISSDRDCAQIMSRAVERAGTEIVAYWGELAQAGGIDTARDLGAYGTGGDLFVDGSLGSHTACLHDPYFDAPESTGREFIDIDELITHVDMCVRLGQQTGFHAIGDSANDAVVHAFTVAAATHGSELVRSQRHRIEHAEALSSAGIVECARLGIIASMQPVFDERWGGVDGMYSRRLGQERAALLNPIGELRRAGVSVAFGSDSPVTPLDPWGAIHAALNHRAPGQRVDLHAAIEAHSRAGWHAAGVDDAGRIDVGQAAHLAMWAVSDDEQYPSAGATALRTVRSGINIHDSGHLGGA
jgi:predicted amidohydrolase YtcJ